MASKCILCNPQAMGLDAGLWKRAQYDMVANVVRDEARVGVS